MLNDSSRSFVAPDSRTRAAGPRTVPRRPAFVFVQPDPGHRVAIETAVLQSRLHDCYCAQLNSTLNNDYIGVRDVCVGAPWARFAENRTHRSEFSSSGIVGVSRGGRTLRGAGPLSPWRSRWSLSSWFMA